MTERVQSKDKFDFGKFYKKSKNTLKAFFSKSYNIILVVFLVILSIGVILPLFKQPTSTNCGDRKLKKVNLP